LGGFDLGGAGTRWLGGSSFAQEETSARDHGDGNDMLVANAAQILTYKTKHFPAALLRRFAQVLLPTHPALSLVAFEMYSVLLADAHALPMQSHKLHVDLLILSAKLDMHKRVLWHGQLLLRNPVLLGMGDFALLLEVVDVLAENLCSHGNWKESLRVINGAISLVSDYVSRVTGGNAVHGLEHSGHVVGDSSYTSSFHAFYTGDSFGGTGSSASFGDNRRKLSHAPAVNTRKLLQEKHAFCDNLQLRLALTLLENGIADRAVDELFVLLSATCLRQTEDTRSTCQIKLDALSLLARAYLSIEDVEGGKSVVACIKTVRQEMSTLPPTSLQHGNSVDASTSCTGILSEMGRSLCIENLGCTLRSFSAPPNYHEGVLPTHCTQDLFVDLGMIRGAFHFLAKEYVLALKSMAPTLLDVELTAVTSGYEPSCLQQLADLYLLRAKIQFEASKNTADIYFPAILTSEKVLDAVVKMHLTRNAPQFAASGGASSVRRHSGGTTVCADSIASSMSGDSTDAGTESSGHSGSGSNTQKRRTRTPLRMPGLAPGSDAYITFDHCRSVTAYFTPADLLRDAKLWFERSMLLYIECQNARGAAKCGAHLARCDLEATFVPCVFSIYDNKIYFLIGFYFW
jgi:hypothetical protein